MIDAIYFDGQSTKRHLVTLIIHKRIIALRGEGVRVSARLSQVKISERFEHAPRLVHFSNGGTLEISDRAIDKLLRANRYREPKVVHWQQNWQWSLVALVLLVALLISGYQWGLPWVADKVAQHLPSSLEKKLGDEGLRLIDQHHMQPSKLSQAEQTRLRSLFAAMKQPHGDNTAYSVEFRDSRIGPNAFALPNGVIIMTDQLVELASNDHAVLGILGHELGHVRYRHSTRRLLQTMGVGIMVNFMIGDVSSVLAAVPTFLLDQKYSRDFERESDQYAIDMMKANNLPLSPMADLFAKMGEMHERHAAHSEPYDDAEVNEQHDERKKSGPRSKPEPNKSMNYLSSHPSDEERIARLRAADAGR